MNEIAWVLFSLAIVCGIAYYLRRGKRSSGTGAGPGGRSDQDLR